MVAQRFGLAPPEGREPGAPGHTADQTVEASVRLTVPHERQPHRDPR